MTLKVAFLLTAVLISWVYARSSSGENSDDYDDHDRHDAVTVVLADLSGLACRPGFVNITDEFPDAVYHCADLLRDHDKHSHIHFDGKEKVHFSKATPILCMKSCTLRASGSMTDDGKGVDEIRFRKLLFKGFSNPGGSISASSVASEFMRCQKRLHPIFPRRYENCTDTKTFWRCADKVLRRCDNEDPEIIHRPMDDHDHDHDETHKQSDSHVDDTKKSKKSLNPTVKPTVPPPQKANAKKDIPILLTPILSG